MDIVAKALMPDPYGVRIAFLDETAYRRTLWGHQPLTDFWRIGPGSARRLSAHGLYTMGDIARLSLSDASLCMIGLASMPSCSLIMPGGGNHAV